MEAGARLGITAHARYRTVPQAQIVELLALHGWGHRMRSEGATARHEAGEALERFVAAGLPFESAARGERRFDPAEVLNTIKWAYLRGGDPLWPDHFVATGRRLVSEFHAGSDGRRTPPPPATLGPRRFSVSLEREFNLRAATKGKAIRLRMPLPLESAMLRGLEIGSARSSIAGAALSSGPGRLDAKLPPSAEETATLGAELSFVAEPSGPEIGRSALAQSELDLYTQPREGIIQVDARIAALAAELAGTPHEPWQTVRRFWDFIQTRLICGVLHVDELDRSNPLHSILDMGWYDCRLGSALLVALCRARGLPARMASGYVLYSISPFYHYWMEIWLGERGWVPLDLFSANLTAKESDEAWQDYFLGGLDYRMQTQCLPRLFDTSPALDFPASWYTLTRSRGDGIEIGVFETNSGNFIFRDRISVVSAAV